MNSPAALHVALVMNPELAYHGCTYLQEAVQRMHYLLETAQKNCPAVLHVALVLEPELAYHGCTKLSVVETALLIEQSGTRHCSD